MNIIGKSIRQMLRTPVRSALFLLLITLAAALLAIGAGLYKLSAENTKRLEEVFVTIGTVEQKPSEMQELELWDAEKKEYELWAMQPEYNSIIPINVLYFEGADYIHPPMRRPYYGAYNPDFIYRDDYYIRLIPQTRERLPIVEVEPIEDCVPDHPIKMKIKRELYGMNGAEGRQIDGWETLWFCDHYNPNPQPLYSGKTYVMALEWRRAHKDQDWFSGEFFPRSYDMSYVTSTQYHPGGELIPDKFPMNTPWDEVTEGFYATPRGRRWLELAEATEKAEHSIPVIPIVSTELLMSFYNGNSSIIEGRDISEEEYQTGQRVCLVSQEFAKLHSLMVEDKLTLPLYYADYRDSASKDFPPNALPLGVPNHFLNAQGYSYRVFEENEYTIIGIYNESNKANRSAGYDMGGHAVVVPAASVENSDENNILDYGPMMGYNTVFQIPNGTIAQFLEAWEKQGVEDLEITFYDRGYTQLKEGLEKIKWVALALFLAGLCIAILILLLFCQMFIGKQKKRTAIERSLGMSKSKCTLSILSGILAIVLLGSIAGSTAGYVMTSSAMGLLEWRMQKDTLSTQYSSWADAADTAMELQLDASSVDPKVCVFTGALVVILSAGIALAGMRSNLKSEPLKLLSMREA